MEGLNHLFVLTHAQKILWRLSQSNNCDSKKRHDQDQCPPGEEAIPPTPVVSLGAGHCIYTAIPPLRDQESPADESCNSLTKAPPTCKKCQKPLLVTGEILEENGCVHDQIASPTEAQKGDEERETGPTWHGTGNDAAYGAHEERDVEGVLAANYIGTEPPEEGA